MKRIIISFICHCLFIFIGLFLYVNYVHTVPELIPGQELTYKLLNALSLFFDWLPASLCASFIVSYASVFGKSGKHIMIKYSPYIMSQFKYVSIFAIIGTTLVVCSQEVGSPLVKQKIRRMEEAPALFKEYLQAAKDYENQGNLVIAIQYATAAERLDPKSQEAGRLKSDLEVRIEGSGHGEALNMAIMTQENLSSTLPERNITSYELLQRAQEAFANKNWIDAHYYSVVAQNIAEPGSANESDAKLMASDAWNMLEEPTRFENSAVEEQYHLKKRAYSLLMAGDVVEAYYSFSDLMQRYPDDEDVARYYAAAALEMESQYFFFDEIPISYGLEDRRDIAFRLQHQDGSESVVFIRGLSSVGSTGGLVQYARGLSIYDFSKNGQFKQSLYVPYAKILSQTISSLDERTKQSLAFTDLDKEKGTVPIIMLESVDRVHPDSRSEPIYTFAEGAAQATQQILTLPMDYRDFLLLKNTSHNPEEMMLLDVIAMAQKAPYYGYSQEVYSQDASSRMADPFLFIALFIFTASTGWNYRIMSGKFQFSWLLTPLLMTVGIFVLLEVGKYSQKLLNYGLFGFFRLAAIPIIFGLSLILVFLSALFFAARRSQ